MITPCIRIITCICEEFPSKPTGGLLDGGGRWWWVGKCGGGKPWGIPLGGLDPLNIGGLWCGKPFMCDVEGDKDDEPKLFLTFKNPWSPWKIRNTWNRLANEVNEKEPCYLDTILLGCKINTWFMPKNGAGGGGGSCGGLVAGSPEALIGLFDWSNSKFCKCCWIFCCWFCKACCIA